MTVLKEGWSGWLPGRLHRERLDNGLEVLLLENSRAPVVTTALAYRFGGRDDPDGRAGLAHFLEHLMFKGSPLYPAGEVDRRTRSLGGTNNAFTTHDMSLYYFSFGRDRWTEALDIEADRMSSLRFDSDGVESEREVILEEIAMVRAEPWDALERLVQERLYGEHPYSRPVVGTEAEVREMTISDLVEPHRDAYRADAAVLVVAGGVGAGAMGEVRRRFSGLESGSRPRSPVAECPPLRTLAEIRIERGEVGRLLLALPAVPGDHRDLPALRVLVAVLALGRSSRLNRRLVDEGEMCTWVSASVVEAQLQGSLVIAAELLPGADPEEVEAVVLEELTSMRSQPLPAGEIERAQTVLLADWVFAHEHVQQQALTLAQAAALFDVGYPVRQLEAIRSAGVEQLLRVASRYLNPSHGAVLGWALPSDG